MLIWQKKKEDSPQEIDTRKLDEMAIQPVSSKGELPFKVAIKTPDHQPPHAHVMDLKTGKTEIGQFLIPKSIPQKAEDIKDYKQGITDEMRNDIFNWSKSPHKALPKITNWDALLVVWKTNER
ncbi:MAG: hypothetical protein LBG15_15460 [Dysgonamonadaceae bacterium]|jgi:hypothetical protein|nr:hypothetical protein [Dysgonamonadaceae bacterium]